MKKILLFIACLTAAVQAHSQNADIKILAVNDMHAAVENFPKFAFLVDSIRALHPDLLLVSAGDNRTGNPVNDIYPEPNLPMVELMNRVGFNLSTMGNHECDESIASYANTINKSKFPYIVCNAFAADSLAVHTSPYRIYNLPGNVRLGVLGIIHTNDRGIPDCHPDKVKGFEFIDPYKELEHYRWMRDDVDALLLLSHLGLERDTIVADRFPMFDVIIGGHSHDLVPGMMRNGVMITQAKNKLKYVNEIDITVREGKVIDRKCKTISIPSATGINEEVSAMVDKFSDNPVLNRVLSHAVAPFSCREELGCLAADAYTASHDIDIAIINVGSVRYDTHPEGPFTVGDVLRLDPFNNEMVVFEVPGNKVADVIAEIPIVDPDYGYGYVGGVTYDLDLSGKDPKVTVKNTDGKKFDTQKNYRVGMSSYLASIMKSVKEFPRHNMGYTTSDALIRFLESHPQIDYSGRRSVTIKGQP